MKQMLLLLFSTIFSAVLFAQSPTFEADAAKIGNEIRSRTMKNGYVSLINYNATKDASFYVKPKKSYSIYFVYDINPRVIPKFNAHVMDPDKSIEKKYSAIPEDVLVMGSAKVAVLQFTTGAFSKKKIPVKIDADPAAKIYIYYK